MNKKPLGIFFVSMETMTNPKWALVSAKLFAQIEMVAMVHLKYRDCFAILARSDEFVNFFVGDPIPHYKADVEAAGAFSVKFSRMNDDEFLRIRDDASRNELLQVLIEGLL